MHFKQLDTTHYYFEYFLEAIKIQKLYKFVDNKAFIFKVNCTTLKSVIKKINTAHIF